jgi:hypothetical protein
VTPPYPPAPPRRGADRAGGRDPFVLGGAVLALSLAAAAVGALGWPSPTRTSTGWQVAEVPTSLLVLLLGAGLVCLAVAAVLSRPWQLPWPSAVVWWLFGVVAIAAHTWNDLYYAALADPLGGAVIPVLDWLFTFVPALAVGLAAVPAGRPGQLRVGLGTAVVGVPLLTLGWSLFGAPQGFLPAALSSLWPGALLGAVPVVVALAICLRLTHRPAPTG